MATTATAPSFAQASSHGPEEGATTRAIEQVTSRVPSVAYLSLALGAMGLSAGLHCAGRKQDAQFVGQWVPTILLLGVYNKLVKQHGSD